MYFCGLFNFRDAAYGRDTVSMQISGKYNVRKKKHYCRMSRISTDHKHKAKKHYLRCKIEIENLPAGWKIDFFVNTGKIRVIFFG